MAAAAECAHPNPAGAHWVVGTLRKVKNFIIELSVIKGEKKKRKGPKSAIVNLSSLSKLLQIHTVKYCVAISNDIYENCESMGKLTIKDKVKRNLQNVSQLWTI